MNATVPGSWLDNFTETVATRMKPKSARMARTGVESEMRMFGWERDDFMMSISRESFKAYPFDIPVRYAAAVEVPNAFDHI